MEIDMKNDTTTNGEAKSAESKPNNTRRPIQKIPRNVSKREMADAFNRQLAEISRSHNALVQHVNKLTNAHNTLSDQVNKLHRVIAILNPNMDIVGDTSNDEQE